MGYRSCGLGADSRKRGRSFAAGGRERYSTSSSAGPHAATLDHRAAAALQEHVGELRALGEFSCALPQALRFVRERVQSLTVAPERPRPGHLYASHLSQAGYAGRPVLFVVGLEEGRVFSSSTEDAVLLDAERAAISADLRLSTDRIDEAVYAVLSRLAVSGASATFSYSCRDTREFRETYASWLMLQAYRLQQGNETLAYPAMKTTLGEPKSAVPTDRESALVQRLVAPRRCRHRAGRDNRPRRRVSANGARSRGDATRSAGVHRVRRSRIRRGSCARSVFAHQCLLSDRARESRRLSVPILPETGLGLRPVDDRERDKDVWLDPLTRGSELHAVYAALLRRTRDENRRPTKKDGAWLLALAQDRLAQLHQEMPAATPEILERENRDFLADLELFLDAEIEETQSTPVGLEVSFGRPLGDDEDPLARAEPIEIALGAGLHAAHRRPHGSDQRGRPRHLRSARLQDRRILEGQLEGSVRRRSRLQHALYGLAAVELLKTRYKKPKAGVYYFSSHKGRQERVRIPAPTRAVIAAVLGHLRDVILTGQFTRTPDENNCRYATTWRRGAQTNLQAERKAAGRPVPGLCEARGP